jgi:predicted small integral membrane protein
VKKKETTRKKRTQVDLRDVGFSIMEWIDLAQDRNQWRALANTVIILRIP